MYNLSEWINPKYLTKEYILTVKNNLNHEEFVKAVVFEDFLKENIAQKLKNAIMEIWDWRSFSFNESSEMERNKNYGHNKKYTPDDVNHYFYKWELFRLLNWFLNSENFMRYISIFYGENVVYQNQENLQGNDLRWWITLQDNTFLDISWWHTDFETWFGKRKRWNTLLYLTPTWQEEFWWCLELWKKTWIQIKSYRKIAPIFNRFVILLSEENKSWHKIWKFHQNYQRIAYVNQILASSKYI